MVLTTRLHTQRSLSLKRQEGHILIPFSAVIAVGDFMVVAEEDII